MDQASDAVFPIHEFDASAALHDVYCVFLRFDSVVDAPKLKTALWRVLEVGDWRKLGGRVRQKDGKIEIHVPSAYTNDRPPFNWHHEPHSESITSHPQASQFPRDTDRLSINSPPKDVVQLALAPTFPRNIQDILNKDVPQLSFKLMTFSDATLLNCSFSHITWDAFGYLGLMRMAQLVLEGRESEIVPMLGAKEDVLEELARPYIGKDGPPQIDPSSAAPQIPQTPPAVVEERIISIPTDLVERLRERLRKEKSLADDDEFIRTDDMCLAWLVQQMSRAETTPNDLSLVNLLNARVLVPSIWRAKGVYPQNMFLLAPNVLTPDLASGALEPIIASQQDCLAKTAGKQECGKWLATFFGNIDARIIGLLLDASRSIPVLVNNLSKLTSRLDIDLSSAMVQENGVANGTKHPGTPSFFYLTNLSSPLMGRSLVMYGSVTSKACLMSGSMPKPAWEAMEAYLRSL